MVRPSIKGQGAISDNERRMVLDAARQLKGQGVVSDNERQRQMDRIKRAQKYLDPSQQGEFGGQEREFLGRKKGGKIKKMNTGGTCS
jgi:hypothetical protein